MNPFLFYSSHVLYGLKCAEKDIIPQYSLASSYKGNEGLKNPVECPPFHLEEPEGMPVTSYLVDISSMHNQSKLSHRCTMGDSQMIWLAMAKHEHFSFATTIHIIIQAVANNS